MLRAESEPEPVPEQPDSRGRRVVYAPLDAINEMERRLCGTAAVSRPAVAEGLALAGRRAATLLQPGVAGSNQDANASTCTAWVHHRIESGASAGFAFELLASKTQNAVDHCLVAHQLAQNIGAPGLCTFTPPQPGTLDPVLLPDESVLADSGVREPAETGPVLDDEALLAEADQVFRKISIATGRVLSAITCTGAESATYALVASGSCVRRAERLARSFETDGVHCKLICIQLIKPFPAAELGRVLQGVKTVLPVAGNELELEAIRRAVAAAGPVEIGVPPVPTREEKAAPVESTVGLAVRPAGSWADKLILDTATRIDSVEGIAFGQRESVLIVGRNGMDPAGKLPVDLMLFAHPSCLEVTGNISELNDDGTLVVISAGPVPDTWWHDLAEGTRVSILERGLGIRWIDLSSARSLDFSHPETVNEVVLDCLLEVVSPMIRQAFGQELESVHPSGALQRLDPQALESARCAENVDFSPQAPGLPHMTEPWAGEEEPGWREEIRRFHLTGAGAASAAEPTTAEPLQPLALSVLDESVRLAACYPMFLRTSEADGTSVAIPFEKQAAEILLEMQSDGAAVTILNEKLPRLSNAVGRVLSRTFGSRDTGSVVEDALNEFRSGFDLSDAGSTELDAELEKFRSYVERADSASMLVGLDDSTLLSLYAAGVRGTHRQRREQVLEEIRLMIQRLKESLSIDDSHDPESLSANALGSGLGAGSGNFLDPQKLAENLPLHRGSVRMDASRRRRIERTLGTLQAALDENSDVDLILLSPHAGPALEKLAGARVVIHPHGLEAAIGLFDGMAERSTDLFRALRVARLEVDGAYDEELHDAALARLGWQGLTVDELLSLPRLVVMETDERLHGAGLGAFSELLRSGRPVQVLVAQSTSELRSTQTWQGLDGFHPGLGYIAMAHREAFVVESSLVNPERLVRDFEAMAASLRPSVALIAVPGWSTPVAPWVQLLAAEQARAVPCFTYDPEAGPHFAERFNLEGNPQPERPWPLHPVRYLDAEGVETDLEQAFTFADAVALDPSYRTHFRILPEEAWSVEQIELADYLAAPAAAVARKIPFIRIVSDGGRIGRAVITRELAYASRDRVRAWQILQELAGTDNEYARRAAENARAEAHAEAVSARESLQADHQAEVERVRTEAAGEAMDRLSRVLMDLDAVPVQEPPIAEPSEEIVEKIPETVEVPEEDADEEEDATFNDAYIDSILCTSCQECILINPRLFKYDANKQAFITDPENGTYEELVKAAEKCPARCIHPGLPIAGDETANEGLIGRAAKFN